MTTPLAQELVRASLRGDTKGWPEGFAEGLMQAKCFECSAALPAALDMVPRLELSFIHQQTVLPAAKTWLEMRGIGKEPRHAFLVECTGEGDFQVTYHSAGRVGPPVPIGTFRAGNLTEVTVSDAVRRLFPGDEQEARIRSRIFWGRIVILLAFINSPRVITRQEHPPHKGLDRELRRAGRPGLRPWTEIKLEISRPRSAAEGGGVETLRGSRALHYCRSHLRVRLGRLERVTGHFRGDAKNGVVRADYKVVA